VKLVKMTSTDSDASDEGLKSFKDRLEDMPAYTMTLTNLESLYATLKGKNAYLQSMFHLGESMVGCITSVAKPVALTATDVAFKVAKPVIGEVKDPVASIDGCASEMLAKVQEKIPYIKQDPSEIVEDAKCSVKDTASYYLEKVQSLRITQTAAKQLDNVVAFSDLVVELCFPTDGSNPEDMKELEKAEDDESKGVLAHARNLQAKAYRRGTRKLMTYRPVQVTINIVSPLVQYAHDRITQTTGKILQGTRFVTSESLISNETPQQNSTTEEEILTEEESEMKSNLASQSWDSVYKTSMFIPKKALEVTGEVYVSAKEMVFAYSNVNTIKEMPRCVYNMAESYKNNMDHNLVSDVKDKALAYVYVPAQVVSSYIQSNRAVQWIIPNNIKTESIQVVNAVNNESDRD